MIKTLIKYLLSLCILLLSGYGHLSAHAYKESTFYAPLKNLQGSAQVSFDFVKNDQTFIIGSSSSGTEKENCIIEATDIKENEEEEYELISFKKHLASSNFFTAIFCALTFGYFYCTFKKILPFWNRLSYITSYRWYVVFQVFII